MSKVDIDIGKVVDYETLEKALIKVAQEVGWRAKVEDKFNKDYRLGSVQEIRGYDHTEIHLRGIIFSAMSVYIHNKNTSTIDSFSVWTGPLHGFASEKQVQAYLSAVSRNL